VYLCVPYSTYTFMVVQLYIIIYIINARRFELQQNLRFAESDESPINIHVLRLYIYIKGYGREEIRTSTTYGCRECRISIISCSIKWVRTRGDSNSTFIIMKVYEYRISIISCSIKFFITYNIHGREEIRTPTTFGCSE